MSSNALQQCIKWAQNNGAYIDERLEFKYDQLTGVHATAQAPITSSDALLKIPNKLLLRRQLAEDHFGKKFNADVNPNALLQLYVAKLKFDGSCQESTFFKPYLDLLPNPQDINSPYFWTAQELGALKGTELLIKTRRNLKKLIGEWFDVVTSLKAVDDQDTQFYLHSSSSVDPTDLFSRNENPNWHSFEAYLWATYIFSSRAFPEMIFSNANVENINQAFLFPIVDLLNHANGKIVSWREDPDNNAVNFSTGEKLAAGDELFNNYGDKSNEELLIGYGFAITENQFDSATLTLRLPQNQLSSLEVMGLRLSDISATDSSVNFPLSCQTPLPVELIKLFGILNKLTSEEVPTIRSTLEGITQLSGIMDQKLAFFKGAFKLKVSMGNAQRSKAAKVYIAGQKRIYQEASDCIRKYQKKLVKEAKPISFKTLFKTDTVFVNSLTLTFGVTKYEDLVYKGLLQQALLIWIVRSSNGGTSNTVPEFIVTTFQDVTNTIVVDKDDVQEYLPFYKSLFPQITTKIPEVYGKGDWGIKRFIVAGTVIDRLVWTSPVSQEAFFFEKVPFSALK
ncbi:LAME_0A00716g1_1 [Lachancea meyersii CBS 8951]|uniref:LAME_0A00716g1_1 n=1 Tax=Lachancea meyersii CBS 8951 TaxID=1266667 RepID=A0A1G4ILC7_9SACH|nr:LAME_0A00716g1_1 [Lachancea meyersii CBS 8951]